MEMIELIDAIKAHARKNYANGWDFIIECYSDSEIRDELVERNLLTVEKAIAHFRKKTSVRENRRKDIEGEIF